MSEKARSEQTGPALTAEQQLALSEIAARNDWTPEQIELSEASLSEQGLKQMEHINEQETRELGLTAQELIILDDLAAKGADQSRLDAVVGQMLANR